jgi:hypothetical protein
MRSYLLFCSHLPRVRTHHANPRAEQKFISHFRVISECRKMSARVQGFLLARVEGYLAHGTLSLCRRDLYDE